ncbi:MAG: ATP-binding protein [bacterium]
MGNIRRNKIEPRHLWHYDIHKKFKENLLYILLGFLPVYKRDEIFPQIRDFLKENQISSYCIYEIYGIYDILVRIWLPQKISPLNFLGELENELKYLYCTKAIPFVVKENPIHWKWWSSEKDQIDSPSSQDISNLSEDIIKNLDKGNLSKETMKSLKEQNILRILDKKSFEGIKFFIVIPPPMIGEWPTSATTQRIIDKLKILLTKIMEITEPSIYVGSGFAWLLVKGKISFSEYLKLNDFIQEISKTGVEEFNIRAYTYFVTNVTSPYYIEKEGISSLSLGISEKFEITDYLNKEENGEFEVKGSLCFDIDRWCRDENYKGELSNEIAINGVLKSIVGFLNAKGGIILVGVLEKERYRDVLEKSNNPLSKLPQVKNRIVSGINREYGSKAWDVFSRKLTDLIREHIGREVSAMVTVQRYTYKDIDLCLIQVPKGKIWYYLDETQFYVRRSNSTILLEGYDMDLYKESFYRGVLKNGERQQNQSIP